MSNKNKPIDTSLIKQLRDVGLKQNEGEIYLWLLQNAISTPPAIARGTGIARTNCYNILQTLLEKDVVTEQLKGKKKVYIARDPKSLKLSLERKIESVERLLPDLEALHNTQKNKPLFRFYDGFPEVKAIYESSLSTKEIYAIGSTEGLEALDSAFFDSYMRQCDKKHIIFHDLLTAGSAESSKIISAIRHDNHPIKFLPAEYSQNITDMLVWDDTVALISLSEPVFGTMIQSQALADTFRTIFKLLWSKI